MINLRFIKKVTNCLSNFVCDERSWSIPDVNKLPDPPATDTNKEADYTPPVDPKEIERVLRGYGVRGTFTDYHIGSAVTCLLYTSPSPRD